MSFAIAGAAVIAHVMIRCVGASSPKCGLARICGEGKLTRSRSCDVEVRRCEVAFMEDRLVFVSIVAGSISHLQCCVSHVQSRICVMLVHMDQR